MINSLHKTLLSPLFLIALCVLLVNDFFLKSCFHNYLTGKLSDFAGLFVFALFWTALFPKWKPLILSLIAAFFTFWKSPHAGGSIEWWNSLGFLTVARTVDDADLLALCVLPAAWIYGARSVPLRLPTFSRSYALTAVALASVFAFTATSQPRPDSHYLEYGETYTLEPPPLEVLKKLQGYETDFFYESKGRDKNVTSMSVSLREKFCDDKPTAGFEVSGRDGKSDIKLKSISYTCQTIAPENQEKLKKIFEAEVLGFLGN